MNTHPMTIKGFKNLEAAKKRFPKVNGPLRILVLNKQGLPIIQVSSLDDFAYIIDDVECAEALELAREVYSSIKSFRGKSPERVAFFFRGEVITVEHKDPFIILMNWSENTFCSNISSEGYIRKLESTLFDELS